MKQANNTDKQNVAEPVERRVSTEGNSSTRPEAGTQNPAGSEEKLARIRAIAREDRKLKFVNLLHHISGPLLHRAYQRLKKNAAAGIDGETWTSYGKELEANIHKLHKNVQKGRYKAKAVLRKWIDKPDGSKRPLGITCIEDKILQQAMVWVLESIYEQDFLGFSYGFRTKRNQHNALDALYVAISQKKVSYVLDADIKGFFDQIDQQQLMRFIQHRISDRRIQRLIEQTLHAGVIEESQWSRSKTGIPQGGVISPLLANIYLHYAFDQWADQWRKRYARGEVYIIRYADDIITCFQYEDDGKKFKRALEQRLARFNLTLHPKKTKLIEFGRFACDNYQQKKQGKPETFDFLGFTHICSKRRKDGKFTVRRQTIAKRQKAKLNEIRQWLKMNSHRSIKEQGEKLRSVIQGAMNYYGVPGNLTAISAFRTEICKSWLRTLRRRSHKAGKFTWKKMQIIVSIWIPYTKTTHPYPNQRLSV
jgi:group II intron reverse transcriptase/maturase